MKPFNLEDAKAGKPVCTRDGRTTRIVDFNYNGRGACPLLAIVTTLGGGVESVHSFTATGVFNGASTSDLDLFMAPITTTVWVNLYRDQKGGSQWTSDLAHITQAAAQAAVVAEWDLIGTFPITYEE